MIFEVMMIVLLQVLGWVVLISGAVHGTLDLLRLFYHEPFIGSGALEVCSGVGLLLACDNYIAYSRMRKRAEDGHHHHHHHE